VSHEGGLEGLVSLIVAFLRATDLSATITFTGISTTLSIQSK
jgi:hypothetical protein